VKNKNKKIGVLIGRFQPFHNAHKEIIDEMLNNMDRVLILVGSGDRHLSFKNPFRFTEIKKMIINAFDEKQRERMNIISIPDYLCNDDEWADKVHEEIYSYAFDCDIFEDNIYLYGHNKDESSYYLNLFPKYNLSHVDNKHDNLSSTDIRDKMSYLMKDVFKEYMIQFIPESTMEVIMERYEELQNFLKEEENYLKQEEQKFSKYPYPDTLNFVTVDFVLFLNNEVLCIKRKFNPGKDALAVPGGFLNNNENSLTGALRELREETGIDLNLYKRNIPMIDEKLIFDHPKRSLYGRRLSIVYGVRIRDPQVIAKIKKIVKASDDAKSIEFIDIEKIETPDKNGEYLKFFDDHRELILEFNYIV